MAKVLNQTSLRDMLEYHVGDERYVCRDEISKMIDRLVNFIGINLSNFKAAN